MIGFGTEKLLELLIPLGAGAKTATAAEKAESAAVKADGLIDDLSVAGKSGGAAVEGAETVVGNKSVVNAMSSNAAKYESNLAYDCSEIAEDLAYAAGGKGEIITIKSSTKYGTINVTEYGETKIFDYHTVYFDGKYVYDPRFSNRPVPIDEYMNSIKKLNDGNVSVSTQILK
ncbi:hypothetical protein E6C55_24025 [Cohnella fermenti]|uniref:Uncharacterized protein n=2 Tax=Cohnella fermenti TaxID=2565925 RepID=A0A4V3WE48_9BACL|nr:hypothetical protein E6C55_24025 [Cohnella fermenti]